MRNLQKRLDALESISVQRAEQVSFILLVDMNPPEGSELRRIEDLVREPGESERDFIARANERARGMKMAPLWEGEYA